MALIGWSSFQYESRGWSLVNCARTAGVGQSGLAGIYATSGVNGTGSYAFSSKTEIITGWCFKAANATAQVLFSSNAYGSFTLQSESSGAISAYRRPGSSHELLGSSANGLIADNVETYIELRLRCSATVGQVEVRLNGNPTPVLNLSGLSIITNIAEAVYNLPAAGARVFSAWYLLDTTGGVFDDFLGHIRYGCLNPDGNGNSSQFVGSDGNSTNNYLLVDDGFTHDSDTTYVQSPTVGDKDTYAVGSLPTPPLSILLVSPVIIAKKTDAGSRAITPVIRSGGTDYDAYDEHFLSTSYDAYKQAITVDPATATAWTESGITNMEVGVEVTT
jgi:hypothetical protein